MMPQSVPDFCRTALKRILVNSDTPSPKITPTQLKDAITEFNYIADSWGADGRMLYSMQFYTFPLTPGQQTYTIGANTVINGNTVVANFNTGTQPRPSYLEFAAFEQTNSNPYTDLPISILDAAEWASIITKNIQSGIGFYVYMDGAWPQANFNIWPIPQVPANIVLTTWLSLNSNVGDGDTISLPPAYARGLSLDLSIALAPYYSKAGSATVTMLASQLSAIKKDIGWVNLRGGQLRYSGQSQGSAGGGGVYDILSDRKF